MTTETEYKPKLIVPLVHLNGSGKQNLTGDYSTAACAINDAMATLARTTPHMRDYYPLQNGDEIYKKAREQHDERMNKMRAIVVELNFLAQEVYAQ